MKSIFLVIFLLIGVVTTGFSQCDKKVILQASKSQLVDDKVCRAKRSN